MANKKKNNRKKKASQQSSGNNAQVDSNDKHKTEDILNEDTTSTPTTMNDNHENDEGANDEVEKPADEGSNDEMIDAPHSEEIVTVEEKAEGDVTEDNVTKVDATEDDVKDMISEEDNKESAESELNTENSPKANKEITDFKDISDIASSDAESESNQQEESKLRNDNVSIPSDEQDDIVNRSDELALSDEEYELNTKSESEPKWIDEQEKDTNTDEVAIAEEEEIRNIETVEPTLTDILNIETSEPTLTDEQKEKSTGEENEIINSQESNITGNNVEAENLPKETAVDPTLTDSKEDVEEPAPEESNENAADKQFQDEKTEELKVESTPTLVDAKDDIQSETKGEETTATIEKSSNQNFYSLEALMKPIDGVEWARREAYLSDDDFKCHLGVSKEEFAGMAKWKQQSIKKKAGIF